jgi:outer membrane lipopolysaccharide assembly protein LptE/RlpB
VKTISRFIPLMLLACIITACGYRNPNVYSGPEKSIYITQWKNRTSELNFNSKIYRSLTKWFQKSGSISVVRKKDGADLILAGEIVSIELPSLSYSNLLTTSEVNVKLRVRYILKEIASKKIILEEPNETWTQQYLVSDNNAINSNNENEALESIIEELSQKIFQRTVSQLPKL